MDVSYIFPIEGQKLVRFSGGLVKYGLETCFPQKIQMTEIILRIHKNDGIDYNFNMVLSILNINNSINTNFSPACSL